MQPTQSDVHYDEVLTNISIAYIQDQTNFIATKVFPVITVAKQSDKYVVWDKNDWFRDEARKRADSTESAGSGFSLSRDSYFCDVYAIHKDLGAQTKQNQDAGLSLEETSVQFVTHRILLRQEIQWVSDYFTTSVWGTDYTVTNQWSDYTSSDPIEDIEANKETMLSTTGFEPNTLVIGYSAWRKLKQHPDIVDRIKLAGMGSGSPARVTPQAVAAIFEIDNLYIAKAIKATNLEGETAAYGFTHGKHAWMGYVNPSPGRNAPSAGYIFSWDYANIGATVLVDRFEIRQKKTERFEAESAWDNKVVATDLGVFFPSVVA
jgi:hypothetical protein